LDEIANMHTTDFYRTVFLEYLQSKISPKEPLNLYAPFTYILGLGGKRLRPVLTLLTAEIYNGSYKDALDAALAIEVFHNFSLVHDDIMDDAPLRRGSITVHEKWDVNTGILSGDAMLIHSYQLFESYEKEVFRNLVQLFSKTGMEVCEGQQIDIDFETRDDVTISEYLKMITYKTAVLVAAAMKMGVIIAGGSKEAQDKIYDFGKNLGIAFQLQDDYLDAFGDPKSFGKQIGGDIIENKKTLLYLKAKELATKEQSQELEDLFSISPQDTSAKIDRVKELFVESGATFATKQKIKAYTEKAFTILNTLDIDPDKKELLRTFGEDLMYRTV